MKVALIGFGTVNRGVWEILQDRKDAIRAALGQDIEVSHIVLRPESVKRGKEGIDPSLLRSDYEAVLKSGVDVVVEATGALEEGFSYMKKALEAGIGVVTANKAVVSAHFEDLHDLARDRQVPLMYEAAVGGGIPALTPIRGIQVTNQVSSIRGILNGTCNYLLNKMFAEGADYGATLKVCQDLGYAEQDPTDDVEGFDTLRKLRILTSMAMAPLKEEDILLRGISAISKEDVAWAKEAGLKIKLVAQSSLKEGRLSALVEPVLLDEHDSLAALPEAINAIELEGHALGQVSFTGPGAGKLPTGHAIVQDLMDIAHHGGSYPILKKEAALLDQEDFRGRYYVRGADLPLDMVEEKGQGWLVTKEILRRDLLEKVSKETFFARLEK
ncbi:MAG: homoserine dehydrogenase [Tissierellia bacterium]|nr:homoserine dehydrogenase [Tissierellia bacterium]